jgi:Tol biopolymer transport system component
VETEDAKEATIWTFDLKHGGSAGRLTFGGRNRYPLWTPDGRRITFQSDRDGDYGIFWQMADGTAPAERLAKPDPGGRNFPESWSPDGKTLIFSEVPPFDGRVAALSTDSGPIRRPLGRDLPAQHGAFSPDGKWLAYVSTEIGNRREVFVQPIPPTGAKYQITTEGGTTPAWAPDHKQLYYWANLTRQFIAVDVRTEPAFTVGTRVALPISGVFFQPGLLSEANYAVMPDGTGFVVVTPTDAVSQGPSGPGPQAIDIILNWTRS